MHVKTNIELDAVDIATLAVCPLLCVWVNSAIAMVLVTLTVISFLISVFVCSIFNRYLSNNMKIFVTAFISVFVVTIFNLLLENASIFSLQQSNTYFLSALSAVIMTIDVYYIDTKAVAGSLITKTFVMILLFFLMTMIFMMIREFLSAGTLFGAKLFSYSGYEFFGGIVFALVLLGILSASFDAVYRIITRVIYENEMEYEKFVKQVRNEKIFQYDTLRRKKLLSSPVEVRNIDTDEADIIKTKSDTNEAIEDDSQGEQDGESQEPTKKRKKNRRLKVSKEAKEEQKLDKESRGGDDND